MVKTKNYDNANMNPSLYFYYIRVSYIFHSLLLSVFVFFMIKLHYSEVKFNFSNINDSNWILMNHNESWWILMNLDLFFFNQDLKIIKDLYKLLTSFDFKMYLNGIDWNKRYRDSVAFYTHYFLLPNMFKQVLLIVFDY